MSVRSLGISRYVVVLSVRFLGVSRYVGMLLIRSPSILEFHQYGHGPKVKVMPVRGLWSSPGKIPNALSAQRYRMESNGQKNFLVKWSGSVLSG
ncbi:hypothetical protein Taro_050694 [Colocasia esculenta]|uniref:Uncharacterized protein n=1 Tax=Colocasia esculenta TaxID=4460 RepID=A0A843XE27_COLES|nr:hypothetical protein [Colocasia esculenta]